MAVSKRFYAARRIFDDTVNKEKTEGINRSYRNHNLLIIERGSGASASEKCHDEAVANAFILAPREIIRVLDENSPNTALTSITYAGAAGTANTVTGDITGSQTDLSLYISEIGTCYIKRTSPVNGYACVVSNGVVNPTISGVSEEHRTPVNPSVFATCTGTCNWPSNF